MYTTHFGFAEKPFKLKADRRFIYATENYNQLRKDVLQAIKSRQPVITVTGPAGSGKTTLLEHILSEINPLTQVLTLGNPTLPLADLITELCRQLDIDAARLSLTDRTVRLRARLGEERRKANLTLLVIDDAHNADAAVLRDLLSFCGAEADAAESPDPLSVVLLAGLAELRHQLPPHVRATACELSPLHNDQIADYIAYQLQTAGSLQDDLFTPNSIDAIAELTHGNPRTINSLCDAALFIAAMEGQQMITPEIIDKAAQQCFLKSPDRVNYFDEQPDPSASLTDHQREPLQPQTITGLTDRDARQALGLRFGDVSEELVAAGVPFEEIRTTRMQEDLGGSARNDDDEVTRLRPVADSDPDATVMRSLGPQDPPGVAPLRTQAASDPGLDDGDDDRTRLGPLPVDDDDRTRLGPLPVDDDATVLHTPDDDATRLQPPATATDPDATILRPPEKTLARPGNARQSLFDQIEAVEENTAPPAIPKPSARRRRRPARWPGVLGKLLLLLLLGAALVWFKPEWVGLTRDQVQGYLANLRGIAVPQPAATDGTGRVLPTPTPLPSQPEGELAADGTAPAVSARADAPSAGGETDADGGTRVATTDSGPATTAGLPLTSQQAAASAGAEPASTDDTSPGDEPVGADVDTITDTLAGTEAITDTGTAGTAATGALAGAADGTDTPLTALRGAGDAAGGVSAATQDAAAASAAATADSPTGGPGGTGAGTGLIDQILPTPAPAAGTTETTADTTGTTAAASDAGAAGATAAPDPLTAAVTAPAADTPATATATDSPRDAGGEPAAVSGGGAPVTVDPERIATLLARAERQIADNLLTTPADDNAFDTYREVLSLQPDNGDALAGLERIKTTYQRWASGALSKGATNRAISYYERALRVAPGDAELLSTLERLRNR